MEMTHYNDELIQYAITTQDFDQITRKCSSVEEQYQLQIRFRDCLLERQAVNDEQLVPICVCTIKQSMDPLHGQSNLPGRVAGSSKSGEAEQKEES